MIPMIVQPNFLDHWKTHLLVSELGGDELAPLYVLRLWGHCQEQKTSRFPRLSAPALAAICRTKTSAEQLWLAMQTSGFIREKNGVVIVHQWEDYNAGLITSWENGKKGGRPKKPTGNPRVTHGQPEANPLETDREDKIEKIDGMKVSHVFGGVGEAESNESIYYAYPRKVGKQAAMKAISRAVSRLGSRTDLEGQPPREWLRQRAQAYAEAVAKWPAGEERFIPHPATWFNRGSYDDDPATWERNTEAKGRAHFA